MTRLRFLAIGTLLIFAMAATAHQNVAVPTVQEQMSVLTQKLDLSSAQQAKIKPILEELHDITEKLIEDKSLSHDERLARVRPARYKADRKMREVLNEDQKRKLDQYEQGPHPEVHGRLTGSAPPAAAH